MIFSTAFLSAAVPLAVLVLTTTVWIAAATGTATIFFGALLSQPNISYAVFRHLLALVGVSDGVITLAALFHADKAAIGGLR